MENHNDRQATIDDLLAHCRARESLVKFEIMKKSESVFFRKTTTMISSTIKRMAKRMKVWAAAVQLGVEVSFSFAAR